VRLPWSIGLLSVSILISWVLGIIAGTLVGWRRGTKFDTTLLSFSLFMSTLPRYLLAILLVLVFGYGLTFFPTGGAYAASLSKGFNLPFILSVIKHAILPGMSFVLVSTFAWLITSRAITVTILGADYLLYAQAKGLKRSRIFRRYVLRNSLLPQVTGLAMSIGSAVSGFYLVEMIFRYPGMGSLLALAVQALDYNTIQGIVFISIVTVLSANLAIDIMYPFIDPRIGSGE